MNIEEWRKQNPSYADRDDETIAKAIHQKSYAHVPYEAFAEKFLGVQRVVEEKQFRSDSEIPLVDEIGLPSAPKEQEEASLGEKVVGAGETVLSTASGMTTGALGYMTGLLNQLSEEIASGQIGSQESAQRVQQAAIELASVGTYEPRTEKGQEYNKVIAKGAEVLTPVAPHLMSAQTAGFGARVRGGDTQKISDNPKKAIQQAAPDKQTLKATRTQLYDELDNVGMKVKPEAFDNFVKKLDGVLKKEGLDKDLTPSSYTALQRFKEEMGQAKSFRDIDTLRKKAQIAAKSLDPSDKRLGVKMLEAIDIAIDSASQSLGTKAKRARELHGRIRKSETVTQMIESAKDQASGFENGLRIEARKILRSDRKRKFFTKNEINALQDVSRGTTLANVAKFLGKFGISENQATQLIGATIGAGGGATLGSLIGGAAGAGIGAITVPVLGQFAKKAAQRLTLNNMKYAESLTRAGKDGLEITKSYFKHTPKEKRNVSDLTELLLGADLKRLESFGASKADKKLLTDARFLLEKINSKTQEAGATALLAEEK